MIFDGHSDIPFKWQIGFVVERIHSVSDPWWEHKWKSGIVQKPDVHVAKMKVVFVMHKKSPYSNPKSGELLLSLSLFLLL